jgi:hypothetical protein
MLAYMNNNSKVTFVRFGQKIPGYISKGGSDAIALGLPIQFAVAREMKDIPSDAWTIVGSIDFVDGSAGHVYTDGTWDGEEEIAANVVTIVRYI